jgi:hypothetical protein
VWSGGSAGAGQPSAGGGGESQDLVERDAELGPGSKPVTVGTADRVPVPPGAGVAGEAAVRYDHRRIRPVRGAGGPLNLVHHLGADLRGDLSLKLNLW